ncbi:MAG TPA: hypothetical protein VFM11_04340 [Burkholderiales bacterium]|nr:hypothetical protein [Burkholderiales bacterium]
MSWNDLNRQDAKRAKEDNKKPLTAKAQRRKERSQRTSDPVFLCVPFVPSRLCGYSFSLRFLRASAPLRLQLFFDLIFLGALGALAVSRSNG